MQNETSPICTTVLVVDDDMAMRYMAKESLEGSGFSVVEANNGQEALLLFVTERPGIILMDVMMPVMDGFAACRELRKLPNGKHVPILMMTSLNDVESIKQAYEEGATDFITKPIDYLILVNRVRYMLRAQHVTEQLRVKEQRLDSAHRVAQLGFWEYQLDSEQLILSEEIFRLFGLTERTFNGSQDELLARIHPDDRQALVKEIAQTIESRQRSSFDVRVRATDGSEVYVHQEAEVLANELTGEHHLFATVQDITKRKVTEKKILKLAYYDELTKLPNRSYFMEYVSDVIKLLEQQNSCFAILTIDINNFARINDSLGRGPCDELLRQVADRLLTEVRKSDCIENKGAPNPKMDLNGRSADIVAHLSGDEFVVLVTGQEQNADVVKVLERINKLFSNPFSISGHELTLSVSQGASLFPNDGSNVETLMDNAHAALNSAKELDSNNYQLFSCTINDKAIQRFSMENELRRAIENNQFELWYQPKVNIHKCEVSGAEALIRWRHPEKGIISRG